MERLPASYIDSRVHEEHTVAGVKLLPMSLNHLFALRTIESPLVFTKKPCSWKELEMAILICSDDSDMPLNKALKSKQPWFKRRKFQVWHTYNMFRRNLVEEVTKFLDYYEDFNSLPEIGEAPLTEEQKLLGLTEQPKTVEVRDNPIPDLLLYELIVVRETGITPKEVRRMNLGEIGWYVETFGYLETGKTNVISERRKEFIELGKMAHTMDLLKRKD